jgi:hypothetical protein
LHFCKKLYSGPPAGAQLWRCNNTRLSFTGGESIRELIITSAYFPYDWDELPPSRELWDVITYCCGNNLQLIAGCDADACHIVWGNTGINPRGQSLLECLVSTNLNILNKGHEPSQITNTYCSR